MKKSNSSSKKNNNNNSKKNHGGRKASTRRNKSQQQQQKLPSNVTRTRGKTIKRFGVKIRFHGYSLRIGSAYCSAEDASAVAAVFRKVARIDSNGVIYFDSSLGSKFKNVFVNIYLPFTTTKDTVSIYEYLMKWLVDMKKKTISISPKKLLPGSLEKSNISGSEMEKNHLEKLNVIGKDTIIANNSSNNNSNNSSNNGSNNASLLGKRSNSSTDDNFVTTTGIMVSGNTKLTQVQLLKSQIAALEMENKRLKLIDDPGMTSSSNSSKSSNSTTSDSGEDTSRSGSSISDGKDFDMQYTKRCHINDGRRLLEVCSLIPQYIAQDETKDNNVNRNLLIAIDLDEDASIHNEHPQFIGILEKMTISPKKRKNNKKIQKKEEGTTNKTKPVEQPILIVEDRTRVDIFYHAITKALFFSLNIRYYSNGLYKFILKANTDNGLIESNRIDFQILSPEEAAARNEENCSSDKGNGNDDDDDDDENNDSDGNNNNFRDFDDFDPNDHEHFSDGNGRNDDHFFDDDFSNGDFDTMFDNYKDNADPSFNRYFIVELSSGAEEEGEDGEVLHLEGNDATLLSESTNSSSGSRSSTDGGPEDVHNIIHHPNNNNKAFTAISIDNDESTGKRLMNAPTYLIILLLALLLFPTMSRAKDNDKRDPVLKYGAIMVEKIGLTTLSTNVCSYLTSMDCTEHVKFISTVPEYQKSDYYPVVRQVIPFFSPILKKAGQIFMVGTALCFFCLFPDNFYLRDRFGYSVSATLAMIEIARVFVDGYPMVFALPMVGPLLCYYIFETILLEKYFTKELMRKHRATYLCVTVFVWYMMFLPIREWVVQNYSQIDEASGKSIASILPPCTILYSLPTQKMFSQAIPLIMGTRIKGYFPFDWVVVLFITAFVLTLASSYARTYNDGTENMNTFIINCCQIFPYYVSPLLFTGTLMTIIKPVFWLARNQYEAYTGNRWDRGNNVYA